MEQTEMFTKLCFVLLGGGAGVYCNEPSSPPVLSVEGQHRDVEPYGVVTLQVDSYCVLFGFTFCVPATCSPHRRVPLAEFAARSLPDGLGRCVLRVACCRV